MHALSSSNIDLGHNRRRFGIFLKARQTHFQVQLNFALANVANYHKNGSLNCRTRFLKNVRCIRFNSDWSIVLSAFVVSGWSNCFLFTTLKRSIFTVQM